MLWCFFTLLVFFISLSDAPISRALHAVLASCTAPAPHASPHAAPAPHTHPHAAAPAPHVAPDPHIAPAPHAMFNVVNYEARPDGKTDSTAAFLSAWKSACSFNGTSLVYVPPGKYLIGSMAIFYGERCKSNSITIQIDGTLLAPSNYSGDQRNWIVFERVNGLSIINGTLDGQGAQIWACKVSKNPNCSFGVTSLEFSNSNNIYISELRSLNSQMFHISIFNCTNVKLEGLMISAPGDSPNTDGIHVALSRDVSISNMKISTGDDCISIGPESKNLFIQDIVCGPGHGISIGSLGGDKPVAGVENVMVTRVTFTGTQNGLRIKTWAKAGLGFVRNIIFQHIRMTNVQNPIIIDQHYCPAHINCPTQESGIKISNLVYEDIRGTSATEVAMKFDCSEAFPCNGIVLNDVYLTFGEKAAESFCSNASGGAFGVVSPKSCF